MIDRRSLLKLGLLAAVSPSLLSASCRRSPVARDPSDKPLVRRHDVLGRTGLKVGDIGFGVAISTDPRLLVEAFHRGINYFDLVPFYSWSLDMLGAAFRLDAGMKRDAIVACKLECTSMFDMMSDRPMHDVYLECIDKNLARLGRDYVDILQIHSVGESGESDLDWLDPNTRLGGGVLKLFDTLKRQGKIRFTGITSHGPNLLETVMEKTIDSGHFDMMMVALNFMQSPGLGDLLKRAQARGIGIIAMKALANARHIGIQALPDRPFSHAALSWALAQPGVNGLVITVGDEDQLDEFLGASGRPLTLLDSARLLHHRVATSREYCRVGCGACSKACPEGVDIGSMLRCDQYRTDYRMPGFARARYQGFAESRRPGACASCTTVECRGACPFGVSIRPRLLQAHRYLGAPEEGMA